MVGIASRFQQTNLMCLLLQALASLATSSTAKGKLPLMEDLLVCLYNIQEIAALLREPGRLFKGPEGQAAAATLIQACWR